MTPPDIGQHLSRRHRARRLGGRRALRGDSMKLITRRAGDHALEAGPTQPSRPGAVPPTQAGGQDLRWWSHLAHHRGGSREPEPALRPDVTARTGTRWDGVSRAEMESLPMERDLRWSPAGSLVQYWDAEPASHRLAAHRQTHRLAKPLEPQMTAHQRTLYGTHIRALGRHGDAVGRQRIAERGERLVHLSAGRPVPGSPIPSTPDGRCRQRLRGCAPRASCPARGAHSSTGRLNSRV